MNRLERSTILSLQNSVETTECCQHVKNQADKTKILYSSRELHFRKVECPGIEKHSPSKPQYQKTNKQTNKQTKKPKPKKPKKQKTEREFR